MAPDKIWAPEDHPVVRALRYAEIIADDERVELATATAIEKLFDQVVALQEEIVGEGKAPP